MDYRITKRTKRSADHGSKRQKDQAMLSQKYKKTILVKVNSKNDLEATERSKRIESSSRERSRQRPDKFARGSHSFEDIDS